MSKQLGIVIADDHPISRDGLKFYLSMEDDMKIIGEASDGAELVELVEDLKPDIAIIDVDMPKMGGIEAAQVIRSKNNDIKLVLLTMLRDRNVFSKMKLIGIEGYILKKNASKEVVDGIKQIILGESYISPEIQEMIDSPANDPVPKDHSLKQLTKSELRILRLTGEFLTSQQIADVLFVSKKTVSNHRNNICKKLDLRGQHSLLKYAKEHMELIVHLSKI